MRKNGKVINLSELSNGRLPPEVCEAIEDVTLTVGDVVEWQESKGLVHVVISKDEILVEARVRLQTKKLLAVVGALGSLLVAAYNYVPKLLSQLNR